MIINTEQKLEEVREQVRNTKYSVDYKTDLIAKKSIEYLIEKLSGPLSDIDKMKEVLDVCNKYDQELRTLLNEYLQETLLKNE